MTGLRKMRHMLGWEATQEKSQMLSWEGEAHTHLEGLLVKTGWNGNLGAEDTSNDDL